MTTREDKLKDWHGRVPFHWDPIIKSGDYRLGDFVALRPSCAGVELHGEIRCLMGDHQAIIWCGETDFRVIDLRTVAVSTRHVRQ